MSVDGKQSELAWSEYWSSGELHSLPGTYSGNYAGETLRFWSTVFDCLPDHARVLDIGTGNGALPWLLLDHDHGRTVEIDAIDAAAITPGWIDQHPASSRKRTRFHSHVHAESLPFADQSFDLVISQYGIEYSDWRQSLPEVLRTVKETGVLAFVVHHPDSVVVRGAQKERDHAHWLLHESELLETAQQLVRPMSRLHDAASAMSTEQRARSDMLRLRFNATTDRLVERARTSSEPALLHRCARLVMESLDLAKRDADQASRRIDRIRQSLYGGYQRSTDLLNHAPDAAAIAYMENTIGRLRPEWAVCVSELREASTLLGRTVLCNHAAQR